MRLLGIPPPFFDHFETFWSPHPRRKRRLSDTMTRQLSFPVSIIVLLRRVILERSEGSRRTEQGENYVLCLYLDEQIKQGYVYRNYK